jgi:hypothetical protein
MKNMQMPHYFMISQKLDWIAILCFNSTISLVISDVSSRNTQTVLSVRIRRAKHQNQLSQKIV